MSKIKKYAQKILLIFVGLLVMFSSQANAQSSQHKSKNRQRSAQIAYENCISQIYDGDLCKATDMLNSFLDGLQNGSYKECSDSSAVRSLQYNAHVILANIAFAQKDKYALNAEVDFFNNADTSYAELKRARYTATHFRHKYYQLDNGRFGKMVGDWVSYTRNSNKLPQIWIQTVDQDNTLVATLKNGMTKSPSDSQPITSNSIVIDNVNNVVEFNFGDIRLNPGLQIIPNEGVKFVKETRDMLTNAIADQSMIKHGTIYTGEAVGKQLIVDAGATLATILFTSMSISTETITAERLILEEIAPEIYMAKIFYKVFTASSTGKTEEKSYWAEIPMIHLYPEEEMDFSKTQTDQSFQRASDYIIAELMWENSEDSNELADAIIDLLKCSYYYLIDVDDSELAKPFYFLGENINSDANSTFFTGRAKTTSLWGMKSNPINPLTGYSEKNLYIIPLRGTFTTVLGASECVTFTGDWNDSDYCGTGVLNYVNTSTPEFNFTYEGPIRKGLPNGLGIWHGDGFKYVGWFFKGKKIGYGTMFYDDGKVEQGFMDGDVMVTEEHVTQGMKDSFYAKVQKINRYKYKVLYD